MSPEAAPPPAIIVSPFVRKVVLLFVPPSTLNNTSADGYYWVKTDASGIVEWEQSNAATTIVDVVAYLT